MLNKLFLLPTAYLANIEYYSILLKYPMSLIEQYEYFIKQSIRNHCKIYDANGVLKLTIPKQRKGSSKILIKDIQISYATNWKQQHWNAIESAYNTSPIDKEIKFLIESWLTGKSDLLKGLGSETLSSVASPNLYNIEIERRNKFNTLGQNIIIDARITSIEVIKKTNKRIEADVEMKYEDKKISSSGDIIETSVYPSLKVKYIILKT